MDSLSGISVFVLVAETRSFSEAGRVLGVSPSAVGKSVARMEERLKVRLFHRSTRHIALTPEGEMFLERCRRILCEVEAAELELSEASDAPRGKLRVSLPRYSGLFEPAIAEFMQRYPDVSLDLDFTDRMVDVIGDGYDAVVRTGEMDDSGSSAGGWARSAASWWRRPSTCASTASRARPPTCIATPACITAIPAPAGSSAGR